MAKLVFDENGKLVGVGDSRTSSGIQMFAEKARLKNSESLTFLEDQQHEKPEDSFWNLYSEGKPAEPLKFSNGKTQEDVVKEIVDLINQGTKMVFLRGACGTGKSAIALNIARKLGRASIVVPVKALQKQYEDDYTSKKYLVKPNGQRLKIAVLTGRDNHDSIIEPGLSCADPNLPDNIRIIDKNYQKLLEYYKANTLNRGKDLPEFHKIKRIHIAPANPHWSPIYSAEHNIGILTDARKIKYDAAGGGEYIFYHRRQGCSYYDQYLAYKSADVLVFNSAKYLLELNLGRKPATEIEIFDEGDYFLDNLFKQKEINITALISSLRSLTPDTLDGQKVKSDLLTIVNGEETNKRELGIDSTKLYSIKETRIGELLKLITKNEEIVSEILADDKNYANTTLETAVEFKDLIKDVYLTYHKKEGSLYVTLASTNIKPKIDNIMSKSKALVFMSGTLHSERVLRNIFGINDFKIVEAEPLNQGTIEVVKTGREFNCKYQNIRERRDDYLKILSNCISNAKLPYLVQVHSFGDLPSEYEKRNLALHGVKTADDLRTSQNLDKLGKDITSFKEKRSDMLFSTKCTRGVDFPGDTCNSVIFTKYPYPNVQGTFWKILSRTHPDYYWDFYNDSAKRELLQRLYRALRSKDDTVQVSSPDIRVINEIEKLRLDMLRMRSRGI